MMSTPPLSDRPGFHVWTYGCQMNSHDSEHIAGTLLGAGYRRAGTPEAAALVVFNTCCVRQSAEDRAWGKIASISGKGSPRRTIAVTGCMAQMHGADILTRAPGVDLVFGIEELEHLPSLLEMSQSGRVCQVADPGSSRIDDCPSESKALAWGWVPVSHGCDNRCAYCVIPAVRGPHRSRRREEVLADVRELVEQGAVEVVLLGQNVNAYGKDIGTDFASLLEAVAGVRGVERIKFETSHPGDLSDELLETIASEPRVCEYLHLPVQSGSNAVLEAMNRGYNREEYVALAERVRSSVPGIVLTTDIIVGFPGESDDDFEATMGLVRDIRFDAAYTFLYSARRGTPAYALQGQVAEAVKHKRFDRLLREQEGITRLSLEKVVGRRVEVVATGESRRGGLARARTRGNRVVLVEGAAPTDRAFEVDIVAAGGHSLRGSVVREGPMKHREQEGRREHGNS